MLSHFLNKATMWPMVSTTIKDMAYRNEFAKTPTSFDWQLFEAIRIHCEILYIHKTVSTFPPVLRAVKYVNINFGGSRREKN